MRSASFPIISTVTIALVVGMSCLEARADDQSLRPGSSIPLADSPTTARKLGIEWKDLDRHVAAAVERKEKPLSKAAGDALGTSLRAARDHVLQGNLARAREEWAKARAIDKMFAEVEFLDGVILFYTEDEKAEAVWRAWCERHPNDFHGRNFLAVTLTFSGGQGYEAKRNEAVDLAEANAKLRPDSSTAQMTRLYTACRCGNLRKKSAADAGPTWKDIVDLEIKLDTKSERATSAPNEAGQEDRALTLDEAMQLAWMIAAVPSAVCPDCLTIADRLLQRTTATAGPFRERVTAEKLLQNR